MSHLSSTLPAYSHILDCESKLRAAVPSGSTANGNAAAATTNSAGDIGKKVLKDLKKSEDSFFKPYLRVIKVDLEKLKIFATPQDMESALHAILGKEREGYFYMETARKQLVSKLYEMKAHPEVLETLTSTLTHYLEFYKQKNYKSIYYKNAEKIFSQLANVLVSLLPDDKEKIFNQLADIFESHRSDAGHIEADVKQRAERKRISSYEQSAMS